MAERQRVKGQPSTLPHKHQYFPLRIGSKWLPVGNFQIFKSLSTDEFSELEGRIMRKMTAKFHTFQRAYACLPVLSTIESSSKISSGGDQALIPPTCGNMEGCPLKSAYPISSHSENQKS